MATSKAATVAAYLRELEPDRRAEIRKVRALVKRHLPKGYVERMNWGMISYEVPLETYADAYNGQPLCYAALAAQKRYNTLYLMGAYADPKAAARLKQAFEDEGKKFDMGKSCLHFTRAEDLALDAVGNLIASLSPKDYIAYVEAAQKKR